MEEKNRKSGTTDSMEDGFKKATLEMVILRLLQESPMYVYDLVQQINERSQMRYVVKSLYMAVSRLEKFQYIAVSETRVSFQNRLRKYYEITEQGQAYYQDLRNTYEALIKAVEYIFASCEKQTKELQK